MRPENERLKRLLDKQQRALSLPKAQLGELEEEYDELLSRIESERRRLGLDDESVERLISDIATEYTDNNVKWYMNKKSMHIASWNKQFKRIYANIRKSATRGDIDDFKYYKNRLIALWEQVVAEAYENQQISFDSMEVE